MCGFLFYTENVILFAMCIQIICLELEFVHIPETLYTVVFVVYLYCVCVLFFVQISPFSRMNDRNRSENFLIRMSLLNVSNNSLQVRLVLMSDCIF